MLISMISQVVSSSDTATVGPGRRMQTMPLPDPEVARSISTFFPARPRTLELRSLKMFGVTTAATLICIAICCSTETIATLVLMTILMCGANFVSAAVSALVPRRNVSRTIFFVIMLIFCVSRLVLFASYTHATMVHAENDGDNLIGVLVLVDFVVLIPPRSCVSLTFAGYELWV